MTDYTDRATPEALTDAELNFWPVDGFDTFKDDVNGVEVESVLVGRDNNGKIVGRFSATEVFGDAAASAQDTANSAVDAASDAQVVANAAAGVAASAENAASDAQNNVDGINERLNASSIKPKYVFDPTMDRSNIDGVSIIDPEDGSEIGALVTNSDIIDLDDYEPEGVNDQIEIQEALNAAYQLRRCFVGAGTYTTSDTIYTAKPAETDVLWLADVNHKYLKTKLGTIKANHNGVALWSVGRIIGFDFEVDNIVGPGVLLPYPEVDGGAERAALRLQFGGHRFKIGNIQDFNMGLLLAESWTGNIEVGQHVAVAKPVISRLGGGTGKSQGITYKCLSMGGVFSNSNVFNDPLRRASSADMGADLDYITQSTFDLGVNQYVMMQENSTAMNIRPDAKGNTITAYMEGIRDKGYYVFCRGYNNKIISKGPMGAPESAVLSGGIDLGGRGNVLYGVKEMTGEPAAEARTTNAGTSPFIIRQGNRVESHVKMITLYDQNTDLENKIDDTENMTSTAPTKRTILDAATNRPPEFDRNVAVSRWAIADNGQVHVVSDLISKPEGITSVQVGLSGKNELNDKGFQLAYYVEDADRNLYGVGQTMSFPITGEWNLTQIPVTVPEEETQLRVRVSIRSGGADDDDNCQGLMINPWLSFDPDYDHRD